MKEGCKYEKLGDIFHILNGFAFKSTKYVPEGIRVIRITNVQKGSVVDSSPKFYPIEELPLLTNYMLEDGDLLMSLTGNVGRVGIIDNSFLPAALNQRVACLRLKKNGILKQYLYHYLNSDYFEKICISNSKGAAQLNMSTVWLANHTIPIPPLPEQERIVSLLDAEFAKIDAIKANAEKQLQDAKALFQSALKDYLTPKEGWEEKRLNELCDLVRGPFGGSLKKDIFVESGYAIYEQQNAIYKNTKIRYFVDQEKYLSMKRFSVVPGDLIMSCSGTIGKIYIIPENAPEGIINQALLKMKPRKCVFAKYLAYLIESDYFKEILSIYSDGAAIQNIAAVQILKELKINTPDIIKQNLIAEQLDKLSAKIQSLQSNFDTTVNYCNDLKQSILKDIFS